MLYSEVDYVRWTTEQKPIGLGKNHYESVKETLGTDRLTAPLGDKNVGEIKVYFQLSGAKM